MKDSRATKRRILGIGLLSALLGLVLKLGDLRGRDPHGTAADPAYRGERAASPARDGDRREGPADLPPGGDGGSWMARGADDGAATVARSSVRHESAPFVRGGSPGRRLRPRDRTRMRASRDSGPPENQPSDRRDAGAAGARTDIAFDSGDAQYGTQAQVEVPDLGRIPGAAGTMSFWMQPGWQEGNQDDATLLEIGDGRLQIIKNVGFLRFEFVDDGGDTGGLGAPIAGWREGEWHQVTATWNGNQYALYVDGQLVSEAVHDGRVDLPPGAKLHIGSNFSGGRPVAPGTIGRVDLRNRPLGPGEVADGFDDVGGTAAPTASG